MALNQWACLFDSNRPNNGTATYPAPRSNLNMFLDAETQSLFVFGGGPGKGIPFYDLKTMTLVADGNVLYNDIWKFDIGSHTWTLVRGSHSPNQFGKYGEMGVESNVTIPGSRGWASLVFDPKTRCAYIFGGLGIVQDATIGMCDIF